MEVEDIRTVMIDGEKWYAGNDVASILGYKDTRYAVRKYVDDTDKKIHKISVNNGQKYATIVINKHGLEHLVSSNILPNTESVAKKLNIRLNLQRKKLIIGCIRIVIIDDETWYVARDAAKALGYKKQTTINKIIHSHVDDKDRKKCRFNNGYRSAPLTIINKNGLKNLFYHSSKSNTISIAKKLGINLNYMPNTYKGQNIRNVLIDGKRWFVGRDIAIILGYKSLRNSIYNTISKENKMVKVIKDIPRNHRMILINNYGFEELLSRSTMPNALDIAKKFGINVNHILNTRKEQDSIHAILNAFKSERMVRQYSVGTYRIDLYFPKYKLAIECDEHGHADRNQEYEQTRQHYIEDKLGCKFIRYNPDSKDYNIFDVLNRIYKEIR